MNNWNEQAECMFGNYWRNAVANLTGVTRRTVQRWDTGESKTPEHVKAMMARMWKAWGVCDENN